MVLGLIFVPYHPEDKFDKIQMALGIMKSVEVLPQAHTANLTELDELRSSTSKLDARLLRRLRRRRLLLLLLLLLPLLLLLLLLLLLYFGGSSGSIILF